MRTNLAHHWPATGTTEMRFARSAMVILALAPASAAAQSPHRAAEPLRPVQSITRDEAVRRGALHHPDVDVALAPRAAAADSEHNATSLLRPPTLSAFAGFRARAPVQGPEVTVTLTQDIALRAVGDARREAAAQLRKSVVADLARARLDGALRALVAWTHALEAKEVLALRASTLIQAEAIASSTRVRVGSGVGQPRELALAEGEVGTAQAQVFDAEGALVDSLIELRYSLGLSADEPVDVTGDLHGVDARSPVPPPQSAVTHPVMITAGARSELAAREVTLARAQLGPFAYVGGSFSREATGEQIFGAHVGVPLTFVDPSKFEQARLRAHADTMRATVSRLAKEIERDVRIATHDREHWREVRDALRTKAIGPLREALRLARKEYEVGTQDVSMVLLAQQRLIAAEEQLARAAGALLRADAHVSYFTGELQRRVEVAQ